MFEILDVFSYDFWCSSIQSPYFTSDLDFELE